MKRIIAARPGKRCGMSAAIGCGLIRRKIIRVNCHRLRPPGNTEGGTSPPSFFLIFAFAFKCMMGILRGGVFGQEVENPVLPQGVKFSFKKVKW